MRTTHGPVHVWIPSTYDRATAGVVVYVHGFFTNVDRAWSEHRLSAQFRASGVNALFIACEAPDGPRDSIAWSTLGELLATVQERLGELPEGRVAVVAHSGGHRTLAAWLAQDDIDTVVLVDALYGEQPELLAWIEADPEHRLVDAAALTRRWSDQLHAALPETVVFDRFPDANELPGAREARIVYVHSQIDHMGLVTGGSALPTLLRALHLPSVHAH